MLSGETILQANLRTADSPRVRRALALRFERGHASIVAGEHEGLGRIALDVVPPIAESR
jgi:hypothetical protein